MIWPDTLPENESEEVAGLKFDLESGIVSKKTAARDRGYDWDVEQERIEEEKVAGGSVGELLLRQFEQGQ